MICFRKEVNKTDIIRNIPVDAICFSTIHLPIVMGKYCVVIWCTVNPSCDMNKLCLENINKDVFFYRIWEINLLKAILRVKLDQYAGSVRANVLNIQIVVCGCILKDSQQVH